MNACVKVVNVNSISHDEWLKYRKDGIGGSDIGAIVGMNPYRGAFDVFVDKTTDESPDISDRDPVYWGTVLEPIVAKEFEKRSGKKVRRCNFILRTRDLNVKPQTHSTAKSGKMTRFPRRTFCNVSGICM